MTATLQIPAHLITCGDYINGHVVSMIQTDPEGAREFRLVVPHTTHSYKLKILFKDLQAVSFPVSQRGDSYSPNTRNAALGLPLEAPTEYVAPEPIAVYPVGTRVADVKEFDRSMKIEFHCSTHPKNVWVSKDPFASNWFKSAGEWCNCSPADMIVHSEYKPTRNG